MPPSSPAWAPPSRSRSESAVPACDLAWISGRAQNLVSHHLRALKREGLASSRREGKIVFYSLTEAGAELLDNVLRPQFSATS
jgi:DNA-binding transcriptional ArsR family regulator